MAAGHSQLDDRNMNPVVCFFKDENLIYSDNYEILSCPDSQKTLDFLRSIQNDFYDQLKIVQINFEALHEDLFSHLKKIHAGPKASVFILRNHKIISKNDFQKKYFNLPAFSPSMTRADFISRVESLKRDISEGRFYQVNLTSNLASQKHLDLINSYDLFQDLSFHYTGNYLAYLPFATQEILCYSPELFLEKIDHQLRTQPIKGTIKPSDNFDAHLIQNPKEAAELSMIVDLLRNDLNAVGTKPARVTQHREKMNLGYTTHTYSEISVETDADLPLILEKTFPGGSISGCPKIESLQAIGENETYARGFYTGSIGWWQGNDFSLNIAIRSFLKKRDQLFYFAGCGIVYDSVPENEWDEFLTKAGKLNVSYE